MEGKQYRRLDYKNDIEITTAQKIYILPSVNN